MIVATSKFFVEDASGAELRVDKDSAEIAYITSNGEVGVFSSKELTDLLDSDRVCYVHLPGICILMISELGEILYRFYLGSTRIEQTINLTRFSPICEGFDL